MNRDSVIQSILQHKIIVILRGLTEDELMNTVEAVSVWRK